MIMEVCKNQRHIKRYSSSLIVSLLEMGKVVGGRTGGLLNEVLVHELREVAKEHHDRIIFAYADGVAYADHIRTLGRL
jgi:hypothetical protein